VDGTSSGTIGELRDAISKVEGATRAGIDECKQILEAQDRELRDKMDGPYGVKKNFQDLIDAFRRRLEEKTQELYADYDTLDASVHRKINESQAEMSRKVDRDVAAKLKRMDQQLKVRSAQAIRYVEQANSAVAVAVATISSRLFSLCRPALPSRMRLAVS
jgi:hypothetical protein